jgi:hypothetical protein
MEKMIGEQLVERCKAIQIRPDEVIYSLTWGDVLGVIAEHLCERGLTPAELSDEEIQAMLDKANDYLQGEGMPWREVVRIGVEDAWPTRLTSGLPKPEDG